MRRLAILAAALAIVAAAVPEPFRWRDERELYRATAALRIVVQDPAQVPNREGALAWIEGTALALARSPACDHRPWMLAGSARLLAADPETAASHYARGLELGERAELDLGLARAAAARALHAEAHAWLLRAVWISPLLAETIPQPARDSLAAEVARLEDELRSGRLATPPARPQVAGADRPPTPR